MASTMTPLRIPSSLSTGLLHLPLTQAWRTELDARFQPGWAALAWEPDTLLVSFYGTDARVVTRAQADDEPLHLLGDTAEIFIRWAEADWYLELHVSPDNHRAALRWPMGAIERVRAGGGSIGDYRVSGSIFQCATRHFPELPAWGAVVRIPARTLERDAFRTGDRLQVSVSRYDYDGENPAPVHSSTSPHAELNFHRVQDWRWVELSGCP